MKIDYNFYSSIERTHNYVKYSDTDSLFLNIPQIDTSDSKKLIKSADDISVFINKNITEFMNTYLLPKMGVSKEYNYTDFKNEIIIATLLMLDVKKNYSYKMVAKEGKLAVPPKIKYTGIPIIRNDYSKFTQKFLKHMIEDIIMNEKYTTFNSMLEAINQFAIKLKEELDSSILNFKFTDIGIPSKWGGRVYEKDTSNITGMKLYNTVMNDPVFGPLTSGLRVLIKINNITNFTTEITPFRNKHKHYISDIGLDKLTNIVVPYQYDRKLLESRFNKFGITVDNKEMWNTLFSTTCRRVVSVIKQLR